MPKPKPVPDAGAATQWGGAMDIQLIAVGKVKEPYLQEGIREYMKRLGPYAHVRIREVPDEKVPENPGTAEAERVKDREGERVLALLRPDDHVIALASDGELWSSEQLAANLQHLATYGKSRVAFVIGGSLGLSGAVLRRADAKLSFGRITLPHQLIRLVLLEQIYR